MSEPPQPVTDQERWIVENRVIGIQTSYKMTSADTSDSYVTLTSINGKKVTWLQSSFNEVARMESSLCGHDVCQPKYGLKEKVKARLEYEKKHARELQEYKRLKAKFERVP